VYLAKLNLPAVLEHGDDALSDLAGPVIRQRNSPTEKLINGRLAVLLSILLMLVAGLVHTCQRTRSGGSSYHSPSESRKMLP
jgi:hypothetical protein